MIAQRKTIDQADPSGCRHLAWNLWIDLYCETWCVGRNLQVSTIAAYRQTLRQFETWLDQTHQVTEPGRVTTRLVLDYVVYLREQRSNGDSAFSR
jgi:site-specific recombinase XerD